MPDEFEVELIQQAARGDSQAFASLFERYFQSVYNYALSLSNDPASAEDLTQEAFIRAHTHLPSFKPPWNFRSWIFRMTRNLFLDSIRGRRQEESFDEIPAVPAAGPSPESRVMVSEAARRVRGTLEKLTPRNKEVLMLREVHGLSYAEIADVLETTPAYVKTLLARSRTQFQDAYGVQLLIEEPTEDCPEVAALLHTLHDGETLEGRERFVQAHLESCEACQRRRNWLVAQSGLLAAFVPVLPPIGLAEKILGRVGALGSAPKPAQRDGMPRISNGPLLLAAGAAALLGALVLTVVAVALFAPIQPIQAPPVVDTSTAAPSATAAASATSTAQLTATVTSTPIPVITEPEGTFNQNANCRRGPGTAYGVVTSLLEGQTVPIDGRNQESTWWWIALPDGGHCWVSDVTIDAAGPVEDVPVIQTPPPPPAGLQAVVYCTSSTYSVELTWSDAALDEAGYRVYRDGARVANLGPDSTSYIENLTGGGSHTYAVEAFNSVGASDRATVHAPCPGP